VFDRPANGRLVAPGLLNEPRGAFLLADAAHPVPLERQGDDLVLSLRRIAPDAIDTVVALDVAGRPDVTVPPIITTDEPIILGALTLRIASDRERMELRLAAGLHPITVAMFEQTGGFELSRSWSGPGFPRQPVPASAPVRRRRDRSPGLRLSQTYPREFL
jgi:hypothetical protein